MKGCIFWLGGEFSSNFCDLVLPNDDRVLLIRGLCYAELEASQMSRVSINPTFQGAQELSRVKWRGPRMLGDLEAEKETKNLRAFPGTVTVEKKICEYQQVIKHSLLCWRDSLCLCDMKACSTHLTRENSVFLQAEHNAPKCTFIPNEWK